LLIATILLIASLCAHAQAQEAAEGKVVTITPDATAGDVEPGLRTIPEPSYWIGIRGRGIESDVLRTHLQLAEDMGVVVEELMPDSPAAKAGLRKHDIILRANGNAVNNMQVLQSQVSSGKDQPLELKIIRLGKHENMVVVPELRPEQFGEPANVADQFQGVNGDLMQQMMKQFGARNIGPGMLFREGGPRFDLNQLPNGVSVSIQRNNDGPAQITVKQGNKTWHIESDDEASIKELPDDVRPFVQRMLNNGQGNFQGFGRGGFDFGDIHEELEALLPRGLGGLGRGAERQGRLREREAHEMELQERMERLEKRLLELQGRMHDDELVVPIE
jgi:hypothetical protein